VTNIEGCEDGGTVNELSDAEIVEVIDIIKNLLTAIKG